MTDRTPEQHAEIVRAALRWIGFTGEDEERAELEANAA